MLKVIVSKQIYKNLFYLWQPVQIKMRRFSFKKSSKSFGRLKKLRIFAARLRENGYSSLKILEDSTSKYREY